MPIIFVGTKKGESQTAQYKNVTYLRIINISVPANLQLGRLSRVAVFSGRYYSLL